MTTTDYSGQFDETIERGGERLSGAAILSDGRSFLSRFIVYPSEHAKIAHVLWAAHAHLMDAWESTPRIAFLSPEPASGKTRAMEVTELLVPVPVAAVNVTPAYLFRKVGGEDGPPTILFDEIDTVFGPKAKENEEIRALLNSGHRRGAVAGRCVVRGKIVETEEIPSYAAVALAGLGWLPDTILSRSVIIRMRRRAPDEKVEPFRHRVHRPKGEALRGRLAAWAETVLQGATDARPEMPAGVEDRDADVWEPLLAVADLAGGDWPRLAREAATALVNAARENEPSLNIRLLADLRAIFESQEHVKGEALATKDILASLCLLEDAPWKDLKGKLITDRQLSWRLGEYGVKPKTVRIGAGTLRGYTRADLHDVWQRYLPPSAERTTTSATSATSPSFQGDSVVDQETETATSRLDPQHGADTDVAAVADDVAACCGSGGSENPDGAGDVTPVADVAPSAGNGGGPGIGRWRGEAGNVGVDCALKPPNPPGRQDMTVHEALELAQRHGVRVTLNGNNLSLEADAVPPADVVATLKSLEPAILGELRLGQALDRQRREEVERRDITRWINTHFASSPPGCCVHCGGGPRWGERFFPISVGANRADVHASCHQAWRSAREAEARRALGLEANHAGIAETSSSITGPH
jgi:hypothetical protein